MNRDEPWLVDARFDLAALRAADPGLFNVAVVVGVCCVVIGLMLFSAWRQDRGGGD